MSAQADCSALNRLGQGLWLLPAAQAVDRASRSSLCSGPQTHGCCNDEGVAAALQAKASA
eukprot:5798700-Prymnesium_polylepis.2